VTQKVKGFGAQVGRLSHFLSFELAKVFLCDLCALCGE